jgi:hypothetical protein
MSGFWDRMFRLFRPVPRVQQLHGLAEPMLPQERSFRLLVRNLSATQRKQWFRYNYFDVIGGTTGARYRIRPGRVLNVIELDGSGRSRRLLCFEPLGQLPLGDVMLSQKIALELFEPDTLAVANTSLTWDLTAALRRSRLSV